MQLLVARCQKQLTMAEQTMLTMDRLPQLSRKATKPKAVESRQFCTRGVHI